MVKLEKELWRFNELKETHSLDSANDLLAEGWVLIEAQARDGKKTFLLGKEKKTGEQKLDLDKEIEQVLEKHGKKYENLTFEKTEAKIVSEEKSMLKAVITGPVFLGIGLWIFFQTSQNSFFVLGNESDILQNALFFAGVVLALAGFVNILGFVTKKDSK